MSDGEEELDPEFGVFKLRLKRSLKRVHSSPRDVEVTPALQVQGGFLKKAEILPVEEFACGPFVKLNGKQPWLTAMLSGSKCSRSAGEVITTLAQELRDAQKTKPTSSKTAPDDLAEAQQARLEKRKSMGFVDDEKSDTGADEDDDEGDGDDEDDTEKPKKKKTPKSGSLEPAAVLFKGFTIVMAVSNRSVYVKADAINITALANILHALRPGEVVRRREEQQQKLSSVDSSPTKSDGAKVRWLFCKSTYLVTYQDASGKVKTTCKGLGVARHDEAGSLLHEKAYKNRIQQGMNAAMNRFNIMDKSAADRYVISDAG